MKKIVFLVLCLLIGASTYAQQKKKQLSRTIQQQTVGYTNFYEVNAFYRILIIRKMANMEERSND